MTAVKPKSPFHKIQVRHELRSFKQVSLLLHHSNSVVLALIPPHTTVLRSTAESGTCSRFSIIGTYADNAKRFVGHVAILKNGIEVNGLTKCPVFQCNPPIVSGDVTQGLNNSSASSRSTDIIADIKLDLDEQDMIATWLSGVDRENYEFSGGISFQQYHLAPHMEYAKTETGRRVRRRFSCVGFVLEAYRSAEIDLITTGDDSTGINLPIVDTETLRDAYPDLFRILDNPKLHDKFCFRGLSDLGLEEGGVWRILMPGYLFHSTVRATSENLRPSPYTPESSAEAEYPHRAIHVAVPISSGPVPSNPFSEPFK